VNNELHFWVTLDYILDFNTEPQQQSTGYGLMNVSVFFMLFNANEYGVYVQYGRQQQTARASSWLLQGSRFDAQLGLSAAVVSLGKKIYSATQLLNRENIVYCV